MTGTWRHVPLGSLLREVDDRGHPTMEVLSVYRDLGVVPKSSRDDNYNKTPENLEGYKRVRQGDLVVNKMKAWSGSLAVSDHDGIVSGDYMVCAVVGEVYRRYLHYLLRSKAVFSLIAAVSTGIRPNQWRLYWDDLKRIEVDLPSTGAQHAVADFLDIKTLDAERAIRALRRLRDVTDERMTALLGSVMSGAHPASGHALADSLPRKLSVYAWVDLGRARSPEDADGPFMTPYLRAANVKSGSLMLDTVLEMNFSPRERDRFRLLPGDILVTEGAGSLAAVGANAVWNGELDGPVCFQNHLLRVRAKGATDPSFLAWWMRFAYETGLLASLASGAQILNLGAEGVRDLTVRFPDRVQQQQIAAFLERQMAILESLVDALDNQIALHVERRQALITAAVTGQLEIPGVAA